MTTQELIENAVLDAMGLLDEDEARAFDRAYRAASPELQAHVRCEQTRLSNIQQLLPQVDPPSGMRAAVIEAVRVAISEQLVEQPRPALTLTPSKKVNPIWRATAIGSLAAAVALAFATLQMHSQFGQLEQALNTNRLLDEITQTYGSRFVQDTLFDSQTRRVVFSPTANQSYQGQASVWFNPDWSAARLFVMNLTKGTPGTFHLAVIDDQGREVERLYTFESRGGLGQEEVPVNLQRIAAQDGRLALIPADTADDHADHQDTSVLMTSQGLSSTL